MNLQEEVSLSEQVVTEFAEFIVSQPSLEQLANYFISEQAQARVHELLEANRNNTLGKEGNAELDAFAVAEHMLSIIKIYALARLDGIDMSAKS